MKLYERQETVIADLRGKLRLLRKDADSKDKQVELAHRTIERLSVEKNGLEAGDAAKKTYIRQLESRVTGMKGTTELRELCGEMQAEIQKLRAQLQLAEEKATAAEASMAAHQAETNLLQRGLQLAAEQLAKSTGNDISTTLLMNAAEGQNEAVELSSQLAESQAQIDEMAAALTAARAHLQTQHEALQQWQQWESKQTEENSERNQKFMAERKAKETLQRQYQALHSAAQEAQRERDAARHRLELEKTAREQSEAKLVSVQNSLRKSERSEAALRTEVQRLTASELAHTQAAAKAQAESRSQLEHAQAKVRAQAQAHAEAELAKAQAAARAQASIIEYAPAVEFAPTRPQTESIQLGIPVSSYSSPSRSTSVSPTKQLRGIPSISGLRRSDIAEVDESLAALEQELIEMAAHNDLMAPMPTTAAVPTALSPDASSRFASPQRRIDAAGGRWRNNPLASPDRPYFRAMSEVRSPGASAGFKNEMSGSVVAMSSPRGAIVTQQPPQMTSTQNSVPLSRSSTGPCSSEEAWRTLEQSLEGQRHEERRMASMWQDRNLLTSAGASQSNSAPSNEGHSRQYSGAQGTAAHPPAAVSSPAASPTAQRPSRGVMRVEIPEFAAAAPGLYALPPSPGIASSRAALSSPDLDRFCSKGSTDWLMNSPAGRETLQGQEGKTEVGAIGSGKKASPGPREVRLHAYAGFSPSPMAQAAPARCGSTTPPKSPGKSPGIRRPVRQSLFDLAKQELTY